MLQIKSYPKSELAMLYFPNASTPHAALNRLNAWIRHCPDLREALTACYQPCHAKFFSAQSVRLITEFLGEP